MSEVEMQRQIDELRQEIQRLRRVNDTEFIESIIRKILIDYQEKKIIESTSTPNDPSESSGVNVYLKDDKFILQFKDGITTRYKYLDLSGTGSTWVHTTTAP